MSRSLAAAFTTEKNLLFSRPFVTAKFAFGGAVGDIYVGEFDHTIGGNAHKGVGLDWGEYRSVVRAADGYFQSHSTQCRLINHAIFSSPAKRFSDLYSGIGVEGVEADVYLNFWRGQNDILQLLMFAAVMRPGEYDEEHCSLELASISEKYLDKEVSFTIDLTDFPNALAEDVGKRANLIYGQGKKAVAHWVVAPLTGVLRADLNISDTTVPVTDAVYDTFPATGTIRIGNEDIGYTGKGGAAGSRTLTGGPRAANGTTAAIHHKDDHIVQVIASYVALAAGHEMKAISQVYLEHNGKIIPISATINLANTTLVGGRTLATITFTTPPLVSIKDLVTLSDTIGVSDTIGITQANTESKWTQKGSDATLSFPAGLTPTSTEDINITFPAQEKTKSSGNFEKNFTWNYTGTAVNTEFYYKDAAGNYTLIYQTGSVILGPTITEIESGYWSLAIRRKNVGGVNLSAVSFGVSGLQNSYNIDVQATKTGSASKTGSATLPKISTDDLLLGRVLFDFEGYKDDGSGTYTDVASARIEKPADVMHHLSRAVAGVPVGRIDTAAFTTARADAPASYKFAGVLTDRVSTLRELLLILGAQSRIRPEWPADKLTVRFLKSSYGAVSKTLTRDNIKRASLKLWRESHKTADLINKVQVRYGRDWTLGHDDDAAFKKITAPATDATSQTRYGVKEDQARFRFDFIDEDNATMAEDLRDFYKDRYKEPARMVALTGYLDNVELLPGDLVGLNYLATATEKFDGLDGTQKFLVEEAGFAPGVLSRQQGPKMRFVLREVA